MRSTQQLAHLMVRYRKDFRAFAHEQLRLSVPSGPPQGLPFSFWPCQIPLVEMVERQFSSQGFVRAVWLKSRQVGSSTLAQGLVAWRAMLWPNVNALVLADEAERAKALFEISRGFYDFMDEGVRPQGRYVTKRELVFGNPSHVTRGQDPGLRSRIVIDSAMKRNLAIGANWSVAHLSECARFKDPSYIIDGLLPAVHRIPGTVVIMESTAEKSGSWFRSWCEDAQKGRNGFGFAFVPWFLQPEYQTALVPGEKLHLSADERSMVREFKLTPAHIKWMRAKLAEMGNDVSLFTQNFPLDPESAWVTAGVQAFPSTALKALRDGIRAPVRLCEVYPGPKILDAPNGRLWIWKEPERGKLYDLAADVASGRGRDDEDGEEDHYDYSAVCVLERGSNEQVAEFRSREVDPFEFASLLYWLGSYYNTAQVAVEVSGMGTATNSHLGKLGYVNQYVWRYRDEVVPRYSRKTGWDTSPRSKPFLIGFAVHELINGRVVIRSERLLREMETYVQKGAREWGAVAGAKDDLVMAWLIALLVSDDENFEKFFALRRATTARVESGVVARRPEPWEADLTFRKKSREDDVKPWVYEFESWR